MSNSRTIILDVEGTTTSIDFVHKTLFPYAREKMTTFIEANQNVNAVSQAIEGVRDTIRKEESKSLNLIEVCKQLIVWIDQDRKQPDLKVLQGLIWKKGYETGEVKGHVYEDVPTTLKKWFNANIRVGIYSSGSVLAQKMLFQFSEAGDLTPFLDFHFDTAIGGKQEVQSYLNIRKSLDIQGPSHLFLSDAPEELKAAQEAGFSVAQLVRPGTIPAPEFPQRTTLEA